MPKGVALSPELPYADPVRCHTSLYRRLLNAEDGNTGIRSFRGAARWFEVAMGTVAVGAGVATLVYPAAAAITVFMLFGASFFIGGILEILFTFRIPGHRAWRLFVGIIDVCLGGYLLTRSPEVTLQASVVLIAATVAISLFVRSAFFFALAFGLRRVQKS